MNEKRNCEFYGIHIFNSIQYSMEILLSHKKEGNPPICNNMDGPWGHYAKWSKSEKDRYLMISLTCGI